MQTDISERINEFISNPTALAGALAMMDDEGAMTPSVSLDDVADGTANEDDAAAERQLASLRTYTDSVPYGCESPEEMEVKLAHIVDKMYVCTKSDHTQHLKGWDFMLSSWLWLRYPIAKATRIKLLHYYYELCLVPGLEPHLIRERTKMFSQLLPHKHDYLVKIDTREMVVDWKPLWRVLKKELWPLKRLNEPHLNTSNLYLFLAELSRRYFHKDETMNILNTVLPLLTKDSYLSIVPVITSFLPTYQPQEYIPALFAIWEAFNSNVVDERMIEFLAEISEEHVSGVTSSYGEEGAAPWQDIGIWSKSQWAFLMAKCLGSMHVPIGATKGASTTAGQADALNTTNTVRIKKPVNRMNSLAKLIIYSMSADGPERPSSASDERTETCFLGGSKALDSLAKIVTSAESFFHPSNSGHWTLSLSSFLQRLASEFCKRWKEEEDMKCKTPLERRLTQVIRREFVLILRTPLLLSLFGRDPISIGLAQGALRSIAMLEPGLIMPQILERAYGGLEVVNETHRTTAVLSMLVGVAHPLVTEKVWLGGQRHLVPLLDLCLPGIDLNDPAKTICATAFISAVAQHIKIGDLQSAFTGTLASVDVPMDGMSMDIGGRESDSSEAARDAGLSEERSAVKESTAGFADWVTALFRRIFALYENLPEEGGKKNMTGGKAEEIMLKSIRVTLDVLCLHLSDELFDLVLKVVYDYATTNAKANAVRAFGQLVACLARAKPQKTISKFLPFCVSQIEEELKHGASSVRTTSSHAAIPSDTTLHWNIAILRGCLGYGGPALLKHKQAIIDLLILLVEKTKGERGYTGSGRLITRLLHTVTGAYPINSRFVNSDEWETEEFNRSHNTHWGRVYTSTDVKIEWHVPSDNEIAFTLEVLEKVAEPLLSRLESLLENTERWDAANRNDFCRYLYAVRSMWSGLPTFFQEVRKSGDARLTDDEAAAVELSPSSFAVNAGFALTDPEDPRYKAAVRCRTHFGLVCHKAAIALQERTGGEDHIDAVIGVLKAIDVYLLEYGTSMANFAALQKNYAVARDVNRVWPRQRENTRHVFLKRAQVYHSARLMIHWAYRRRSEFDAQLCDDLIEFSLSPYTRVRRQSQHVLFAVCEGYPLGNVSIFPKMMGALDRRTDPDRMKGALYVLLKASGMGEVQSDHRVLRSYLTALLNCQHQEKPSIQQLVSSVHQELLTNHVSEGSLRRRPEFDSDVKLYDRLDSLRSQFPQLPPIDAALKRAMEAAKKRSERNEAAYSDLIESIIEIAGRPSTHWRYLQMALQCLVVLMRRDIPPHPGVARLLMRATLNSHTTTRIVGQRGIVKLLALVKIRSFSKSNDELWRKEWQHPLRRDIRVKDARDILSYLERPFSGEGVANELESVFVDKISSGFVLWERTLRAYSEPDESSSLSAAWEADSQPALAVIDSVLNEESYFPTLVSLFSQETDSRLDRNVDLNLRSDNVVFISSIAKAFEDRHLDHILKAIDSPLFDTDRYKQRAAAELLLGVLRGSKHWVKSAREKVWTWVMQRINSIYAQLKPDTICFWEGFFEDLFADLDPRRNKPLVDWIMSLPFEFHSDSVFAMTKSLSLFTNLIGEMGVRFGSVADKYINLLFDNFDIGYAEVRGMISQCLQALMSLQWRPVYPSLEEFLSACKEKNDPLSIRDARHVHRVNEIVEKLPTWRAERLPPPRVNQSQYDKVALSLLTLMWTFGHNQQASAIFPYSVPAISEILKMEDLNDNPELLTYSSAVLYLLSAVTPPQEYIEMVADQFIATMQSTSSWKIKLHGLPILIVFFYRNLINFSEERIGRLMDAVITCLGDDNVEVRESATKLLSGLLRCSQRSSILPLRNRFVSVARSMKLPKRQDPTYSEVLRKLHSSILGICALIESFPYSVEPWMPPLTEVLAPHASDPPPISTTIRKCASEFKKTHQDTWHTDQQAFDEDQQQALSTMLIGTSYYA